MPIFENILLRIQISCKNGNLPVDGSKVKALLSSVKISNYTRLLVGLTRVNDLDSLYYTAQYSKSRPLRGIDSITLDKFYEVIFVRF